MDTEHESIFPSQSPPPHTMGVFVAPERITMNKLVKGSLAGAAGIALLLGGAGTFAFWNDSVGVQGGTVVAGQLTLANTTPGVWTDQNGTVIDPANYRIVPGDVLTYTDDLTVTADGDNLEATLALAGGAIAPSTPGNAEDVALAGFLTDTAVLAATGDAIVDPAATGNTFEVVEGTADLTTTVTLSFPYGTLGSNNAAQLGSVNLENLTVSLVQHQ